MGALAVSVFVFVFATKVPHLAQGSPKQFSPVLLLFDTLVPVHLAHCNSPPSHTAQLNLLAALGYRWPNVYFL